MNLPRVEVQATAWQTFNPIVGLGYTFRMVVDDLLPGAIGITGRNLPIPWVLAGWLLLIAAGAWWWRQAAHRRLLLLGLGFIFSNYWLVFSARAYFTYEEMHEVSRWLLFTRYHAFAQVGLALFVCGGWPAAEDKSHPRVPWLPGAAAAGSLALLLASVGLAAYGLVEVARSGIFLEDMPDAVRFDQVARIGLVFLVVSVWLVSRVRTGHLGKNWLVHVLAAEFVLLMVLSQGARWRGTGDVKWSRRQQADLRRIETVDALCRAHHISADMAREVLTPFEVTGCNAGTVNGHLISGWDFLRGSPDPRATVEEARRALVDAEENGLSGGSQGLPMQ
jgi:hypothetical protein